jgi:hypothetical protein
MAGMARGAAFLVGKRVDEVQAFGRNDFAEYELH